MTALLEQPSVTSYPLLDYDTIRDKYANIEPPFGPVGYVVYKRTYARRVDPKDPDSRTEEWWQTAFRVVNGMQKLVPHTIIEFPAFTLEELEKVYDHIFYMRAFPSGRFLWVADTKTVYRYGGSACVNCWFTNLDSPEAFCFMFDMLMLGGGVGFSVKKEHVYKLPKVQENVTITRENSNDADFIVPDSREGWVELLRRVLDAFFYTGKSFSYSTICIRERGAPIQGFGGSASGPEELCKGIENIQKVFHSREGKQLNSIDCLDVANIVGSIVVAGNVRRCLPAETRIHTRRGLININQIDTEDYVQTPEGFKKVQKVFEQGKQKLLSFALSNGQTFRCTPEHKIALGNMPLEVDLVDIPICGFVKAKNVNFGDTVILNGQPLESIAALEELEPLFQPTILSYLQGKIAGDCSTYGGNYEVRISFKKTAEEQRVLANVKDLICSMFGGVNLTEFDTLHNSVVMVVHDRNFYEFVTRIRRPHQAPQVPEEIYEGELSTRCAFLAGLMDADGTPSKFVLAESVYRSFIEEVRKLAISLGINTVVSYKARDKTWRLQAQGFHSKKLLKSKLQGYAFKEIKDLERAVSKYDLHVDGTPHHILADKDPDFWNVHLPVQVVNIVEEDEEEETWDIEVDEAHCFYADGLLVHNSAQIAVGDADDMHFLQAKRWDLATIPSWRAMSNNTIATKDIRKTLDEFWLPYMPDESGKAIGEPYGLFNLETSRKFGRLGEKRSDRKVEGTNPCAEIALENGEPCNLFEMIMANIRSLAQATEIARLFFKYAKLICCLKYHWAKAQEVVARNMRTGGSITSVLQMSEEKWDWLDPMYKAIQYEDEALNAAYRIPRSKKTTTVKPSGTLSLLPGVTSGGHPAYARYYIRRIRMATDDPLVQACKEAGYPVEVQMNLDGTKDHNTMIVSFPCQSPETATLADDMTAVDQLEVLKRLQTLWSDNSVSVTIYYKAEELTEIKEWLKENYRDSIKTVSFQLREDHGFPQAPLEAISKERYEEMVANARPITNMDLYEYKDDGLNGSCEGKSSCPAK